MIENNKADGFSESDKTKIRKMLEEDFFKNGGILLLKPMAASSYPNTVIARCTGAERVALLSGSLLSAAQEHVAYKAAVIDTLDYVLNELGEKKPSQAELDKLKKENEQLRRTMEALAKNQ